VLSFCLGIRIWGWPSIGVLCLLGQEFIALCAQDSAEHLEAYIHEGYYSVFVGVIWVSDFRNRRSLRLMLFCIVFGAILEGYYKDYNVTDFLEVVLFLFHKFVNACVGERASEATLPFKVQPRGDPRGEAVQLHIMESRR
jgi:hypothetical protein